MTPHGSRDAVRISITTKLATLTTYRQAESALQTAKQQVSQSNQTLKIALENLRTGLADADYKAESELLVSYLADLKLWDFDRQSPNSADLFQALDSIHKSLTDARDRLEDQQGENTYANAHNIACELIQVRNHLNRINRTKRELHILYVELVDRAKSIEKAIVEHTEGLISKLEDDVDDLYKKIQGADEDDPPLIRFQLAGEDTSNQQQVRLVIDYTENRKGVAPTGYLSDSQIHTVALALRLAAVRTFNTGAPIIVLDDVVTSYDADHRKSIAATLAEEFEGFQIILVTHDEQFFRLLQDHLPRGRWAFRRIMYIDRDFGPVFTDHHMPDEEIGRKLFVGEPSGEEIRKAEEEWLLKICREFRVSVVIRPIDKPYEYQRSELADALAGFLKDCKISIPKVPGVANPFLNSLQTGTVENFASHFSDDPYKSVSAGDEKARWEEFRSFRDLFVCSSCGGNRFKRPKGLSKPVCSKCEIPFEFRVAPVVE